MFEFIQHPPLIGWIEIAAINDCVTIQYKNVYKKDDETRIKLCVYAKKIIVKPKHIINDGYLLVNYLNQICQIGQQNELSKSKIDETVEIFKCDILCPGFVDIVCFDKYP